jgi:hypothetical protein
MPTAAPTAAAKARLAEIITEVDPRPEDSDPFSEFARDDRRLAYYAMSREDRHQMESGLEDIADTFLIAIWEAESSATSVVEASLQELVDKYGFECVKHALEAGRACSRVWSTPEANILELVDNCDRS